MSVMKRTKLHIRRMQEALQANILEGKPADNDFDLFTAEGPIDTDDKNNDQN